MNVCMYVYNGMYTCEYRYSLSPKEGVRSPETEIIRDHVSHDSPKLPSSERAVCALKSYAPSPEGLHQVI